MFLFALVADYGFVSGFHNYIDRKPPIFENLSFIISYYR